MLPYSPETVLVNNLVHILGALMLFGFALCCIRQLLPVVKLWFGHKLSDTFNVMMVSLFGSLSRSCILKLMFEIVAGLYLMVLF